MAIFNSYVSLPEGNQTEQIPSALNSSSNTSKTRSDILGQDSSAVVTFCSWPRMPAAVLTFHKTERDHIIAEWAMGQDGPDRLIGPESWHLACKKKTNRMAISNGYIWTHNAICIYWIDIFFPTAESLSAMGVGHLWICFWSSTAARHGRFLPDQKSEMDQSGQRQSQYKKKQYISIWCVRDTCVLQHECI